MRKLRISDNIGALNMYASDKDVTNLKSVQVSIGNKEKISYKYYGSMRFYPYDMTQIRERIDVNLKRRLLINTENIDLFYSKCKICKLNQYASKIL